MSDSASKRREPEEAFDAAGEARKLMRASLVGTLATLQADGGAPYASMAAVAPAFDGTPVLLLSTLAVHTANAAADARVSLLLDARNQDDGGADPMTRPRVSLDAVLERTERDPDGLRYLRHHPGAAFYSRFEDFAFYRVRVLGAHLVAGFGRIVDLPAQDLIDDVSAAGELAQAEAGIVEHMNEDHADALQLYARAYCGQQGEGFTCVACDTHGLTLRRAMTLVRVPFRAPVQGPGPLRMMLKQMAEDARSGKATVTN